MKEKIFKSRIPENIDPVELADKLKAGLTTEWLKRRHKLKERAKHFKEDEIADAEAKELLMAQ